MEEEGGEEEGGRQPCCTRREQPLTPFPNPLVVSLLLKKDTQPPFTLHPSRSHVVKSRGLGSVYKVYLTSPSSSGHSRGYAVKGGWSKEENVGNGFVGLCGRLLGEDNLGLGGGEGEFQDGWGRWWEGGKEMGEIRNGEGGGVLR